MILPEDEDPGEEVEKGNEAGRNRLSSRHIGNDTCHECHERVGHIEGEEQNEDEVKDRMHVEDEPRQEVGGGSEGEDDEEVEGDGDDGLREHEGRRAVSPPGRFSDEDEALVHERGQRLDRREDEEGEREAGEALALRHAFAVHPRPEEERSERQPDSDLQRIDRRKVSLQGMNVVDDGCMGDLKMVSFFSNYPTSPRIWKHVIN